MTIRPVTFAKRLPRRPKAPSTVPAGAFSKISAVLVAVTLVLVFTDTGGRAASGDALRFSHSLLVTGNYVVGSVDLTEQQNPIDSQGFSTATLNISGVPVDAEIVAAYLYWETITATATPEQAVGVTFRGYEIDINDVVGVKKSEAPLPNSASCWTTGTPLSTSFFRADVLRFLPFRRDKDNKLTVKRLVNDQDLLAHASYLLPDPVNQPPSDALHKVKLPARQGNQLPETPGASLVIAYVDPSEPLRKIVFYERPPGQSLQAPFIQPNLTTELTQTLQGFYRSSDTKSAKIMHLISGGQPNGNERIRFKDSESQSPNSFAVISGPDPVAGGAASQRSWQKNPPYNVSSLMNPGANASSSGGFGETAITKIDHASGGSYDCLIWQAVIFSTAVKDNEANSDNANAPGDGIPDGLEVSDNTRATVDPDPDDPTASRPLPDLVGMGATATQRDFFVEFNWMWAAPQTSYGSIEAPYHGNTVEQCSDVDPTKPPCTVTDTIGHHHAPTPDTLKKIGDRLALHGIKAHFDVGNIDDYHGLGVIPHATWEDDYTVPITNDQDDPCTVDLVNNPDGDCYLVPSNLAKGGEKIEERACDPDQPTCQFPAYAGAVGWRFGFELYRDAQVGNLGEELTFQQLTDPNFVWGGRRRFDPERKGLVHYLLSAHFRAKPRSPFPCLINNVPGPYGTDGTCGTNDPNPEFRVPSGSSGIADLPGDGGMVTMGRFDEFVGRPFPRASTTFHELTHNLGLWHGGPPALWGNKFPTSPAPPAPTSTSFEPNCKPNHQSSISYLYQLYGLFDNSDQPYLDLAGLQTPSPLSESGTLADAALSPTSYRAAWYAPFPSLLTNDLGIISKAGRYCSGQIFDPNAPEPSMARVTADTIGEAIDWNGDKIVNSSLLNQDVNFDATQNSALQSHNDWASLRLNQMGAARRFLIFAQGDPPTLTLDFGSGELPPPLTDFGSGEEGPNLLADFGSGDSPEPLLDFGSGDEPVIIQGLADFGSGDGPPSPLADFGSGDGPPAIVFDFGSGQHPEPSFDAMLESGGPGTPFGLSACIIGTENCLEDQPEFTPLYHRVRIRFQASMLGQIDHFQVQRKLGDGTYADVVTSEPIILDGQELVFTDDDELPDGVEFTWRIKSHLNLPQLPDVTESGWSVPVTHEAVNAAPVAVAEATYVMLRSTTLTVPAPGKPNVLDNDTDVDSPTAFRGRRARLTQGVSVGKLVWNGDGSFTFTPPPSFFDQSVTFKYVADDGLFGATTVPLSGESNEITVTIQVNKF